MLGVVYRSSGVEHGQRRALDDVGRRRRRPAGPPAARLAAGALEEDGLHQLAGHRHGRPAAAAAAAQAAVAGPNALQEEFHAAGAAAVSGRRARRPAALPVQPRNGQPPLLQTRHHFLTRTVPGTLNEAFSRSFFCLLHGAGPFSLAAPRSD